MSAGTTLPTCVFFKLPFRLLCTEGLWQRRRKEDCAVTEVTADGCLDQGIGQSEVVGLGILQYDKTEHLMQSPGDQEDAEKSSKG